MIAIPFPAPRSRPDCGRFSSSLYITNGSGADGSGGSKQEVLAKALKKLRETAGHKCRGSNTLMVGDRYMDIDAAKAEGIGSAVVTFGYASDEELANMEPDFYVRDFPELYRIVTGDLTYSCYADKPAFVKTVEILTPLLLFWVIQLGIYNLCLVAIVHFFHPAEGQIVLIRSYLNAAAAIAVWPYLARCYRRDCPADHSSVETKRKKALLKKDWPQILSCAIALAVGLNLVLLFLGVTNASDSYRHVSSSQYLLPLPAGLVIYGILIPFTEEVLFRGILQNRIRRYYPTVLVIFLSALLFGCYHGNPVQILYAFFMGLAISAAYEYYRDMTAPILMHCSANLLVYFITKKVGFAANGATLLLGCVLILIAAAITAYYIRVTLHRYRNHTL